MLKAVHALTSVLGAVVSLAILTVLIVGGWYGVSTFLGERWQREAAEKRLAEREREIERLNVDLAAKQKQIEQLETALKLLKVDHRVAQIDVLKQMGSAKDGTLVTTFNFVELDAHGKPLHAPRVFNVNGDMLYVDSLVVKFTDEAVETADPLRSTSLVLFRRVFGEQQKPTDGYPLDPAGSQPVAYRTSEKQSEFERNIWARFWEYATNPQEAAKKGIRAAHGDAPSQKLVPGKRYRLQLRASDGLSFTPEGDPPKPAGPAL